MKKKKKNESINLKGKLLLLFLTSLLCTNCGGGGGGGGDGGSNVRPNEPLNIEKRNISTVWKLRQNSTENIPTDTRGNKKGESQKLAIIDSDFITHSATLKQKYPGIEILERESSYHANGDSHGEQVLEAMMEGVSFKALAVTAGTSKDENKGITTSTSFYHQLLPKFGNQKIKVFNQSFGGAVSDASATKETSEKTEVNTDPMKTFIEQIYKPFVEKGAIFVWANGNYGTGDVSVNDSTLEAKLPKYVPELEKGWISAIGVEKYRNGIKNVHYTKHLAYPGDAFRWSISADGGCNSSTIGSSFAAPRVARAAALVAEKFDWMTNDQVRQTLFSTTDRTNSENETRYTESKPNKEYGWGMLNTERALKGPGAFLTELLQIDGNNRIDEKLYFRAKLPEGTVSYFENEIHGEGGLEKSGAGSLHLTGNNSYQGKSIVTEGTLEVHKIHASGIDVKSAGTLVLHSKSIIGYKNKTTLIDEKEVDFQDISNKGNVDNAGRVTFTGSSAIIGGDYTARTGSHTQIGFSSNVHVKGNIYLQGGTLGILNNEYIGESKTQTVLSGKTVAGEFDSVETQGMVTGKIETTEKGVDVKLSRQNVVEYLGEAGESSKNSAQNVEKVFVDLDQKVASGMATAEELAMGASLQTMATTAFATATEKLTGEIYASSQALTFSQVQDMNRDLSNRLAGIENLSRSKKEWNTWVSAIGSSGKLQQSGYASAKTHVSGGQVGIDKAINDSTKLGLAFSYSYAHANFDKYAGDAKSDMFGMSFYGKKQFAKDYYLVGRLGTARVSSRVKRELLDVHAYTVMGDVKHRDYLYSSYFEVGKKMKYITPFLGYSHETLRRGSFTESNAAWGIHAAAKNYQNHNFLVGLRAEYDVNSYKFQGYVTQAVNIDGRDLSFEGHYTGNSTKQEFQGIKQAKNTTWFGAGVFKEIHPEFGIYGNIDFRFQDGKQASSVFSTGVQYKF
ncbi:autotransporter serine protease fusolisin [Fusobacterium necrophorum]|uniref:Serine protease n=2 Tax=Fusobacterium necrophorum TaxID=859 RepID=A0AB73BZY8_9FUSO|nr:autotransporter serine protease fusolisin [Fusobacterium necrophorum]KDE66113.1 hypothetical protein FUSO5_03210 [Fusobacterium necrophorum BFTR-1]KDE69159.1 serine protease [Fusobacterium necrophorum DJ-2]MBR8823235.1 hypothetical protein [Fusobacterium necrophorum]